MSIRIKHANKRKVIDPINNIGFYKNSYKNGKFVERPFFLNFLLQVKTRWIFLDIIDQVGVQKYITIKFIIKEKSVNLDLGRF